MDDMNGGEKVGWVVGGELLFSCPMLGRIIIGRIAVILVNFFRVSQLASSVAIASKTNCHCGQIDAPWTI